MNRASLEPAFVLHHRPYRDSSLLLELFTPAHGRVGAVARGARGPRSKSRGLLQPFQPLLVSWSGRGELGTLTGVERDGAAVRLVPERLMSGFYLNELLLRLLERHDSQQELFTHYAQSLRDLAESVGRQREEAVLRLFERRLLEALGYGLNLTHEGISGRPVNPAQQYWFRPDSGPEPAGVAEGDRTVSGASLLALAAGELHEPAHLRDARRMLTAALEAHLGGRALRTRDVARATRPRRAPDDGAAPARDTARAAGPAPAPGATAGAEGEA